MMVDLLLRVFRVAGRRANRSEVESGGVELGARCVSIQARPKPPSGPRGQMGERPRQGAQRTVPVSSFVLDWERHFDAAQALREVVTP
jgi:hypothetical protein